VSEYVFGSGEREQRVPVEVTGSHLTYTGRTVWHVRVLEDVPSKGGVAAHGWWVRGYSKGQTFHIREHELVT
jgi:hypothetical protein